MGEKAVNRTVRYDHQVRVNLTARMAKGLDALARRQEVSIAQLMRSAVNDLLGDGEVGR